MIKFKIHLKMWEEERCKFGKVLKNYYRFFDIFWDILNKMKENLCQECGKGGLLSPQGKCEIIAPDFPGKMMVFSSFGPTFPPVPL